MNPQIAKPLDLSAEGAIEQLLAFHRQTFGDAVMVEEGGTTEDEAQGDESTESTEDKDTDTKANEAEEDDAKEGDDESKDLPEWAQKELKKVRGEAANYRTRLREVEQQLANAKTPEEYEAAVNELRETNAQLEQRILRNDVARKFQLPDDLANALKGDTQEELEAHAKVLAKYAAPADPESLGGGLDPTDDDDDTTDPRELARRFRRI